MNKLLQITIYLSILINTNLINLNSQNSVHENLNFTKYLIGKEKYDDALFILNTINTDTLSHNECIDSINYFKGWVHYNLKQLDSSALFLNRVSQNSIFHKKSQFFAASNYIFLNKYDSAKLILNNLNFSDSTLIELKQFELAGISLLENNTDNYKNYSSLFKRDYYPLIPEQIKLDEYYNNSILFNKKSKFVAGMMSAIIPGSGKIYAGKIGEGVSSLLTMAILTGITIENYNKSGLSNYKTILFGSLFTVFYLGNIYGSMISVNIYRNEFYATNNKKILLHIHIPLRTIFN